MDCLLRRGGARGCTPACKARAADGESRRGRRRLERCEETPPAGRERMSSMFNVAGGGLPKSEIKPLRTVSVRVPPKVSRKKREKVRENPMFCDVSGHYCT